MHPRNDSEIGKFEQSIHDPHDMTGKFRPKDKSVFLIIWKLYMGATVADI